MSTDLDEFLAKATQRAAESSSSSSPATATARVLRLADLALVRPPAESAPGLDTWGLAALRGRLVELSARGATATLTTAADLVLEAQQQGEPVAWIVPWSPEPSTSTFFPPDLADHGIDLSALVVVRAPSVIAASRAAEKLLRSGAFGLLVLDLGGHDLVAPQLGIGPETAFTSSPYETAAGTPVGPSVGPSVAPSVAPSVTARAPGASSEPPPVRLSDQVLGRIVTLSQAHDAALICITDKPADTTSLGSLVSLRAEALRLHLPPPASTGDFELTISALKDKRRGPGWSRRQKVRGPPGM